MTWSPPAATTGLDVANRDTWTVTQIGTDGGLTIAGPPGERTLPPTYVHDHVELAYATTVYRTVGADCNTHDVSAA